MKRELLKISFLSLMMAILTATSYGQGTTSASLNGKIEDDGGEALIGATVIALHQPTGTEYGAVTNIDGYFYFPNIRVGGPYKVTATYVGFETKVVENITLKLGEKRNLFFSLAEEASQLNEVVITAGTNDLINSGRTGAATNVNAEIINTNPSISRSIEDFIRLTPQAATGVGNGGISIAGSNSRFNNVTIDGAINNDAFGLNSDGLPGSSSGSEPISLDAIEEISILVAPYDVTKGSFTGGGINAVTRSGTNEIDGSVYFYTRNENLVGKTLGENPEKQAPFFNRQYGARVGGPIVKDKVFFFASFEQQVSETPNQITLVDQATLDGFTSIPSNVSFISTETADAVRNHLVDNYGYDPGNYGTLVPRAENNKLFGKIDWNLNKNHQLSLRHSYLHATDENISRTQGTLEFSNNAYLNDVTSNSTIAELRSRFGDNISNNLIVGYTSINRMRNLDDYGPLFPHIDIYEGGNVIRAGSQRSSVGNELEQGIGQLTNNFTVFKNKHVITFGTHNEWFHIYNSFVNRYNGHYEFFGGLNDFLGDTFNGNSNNRFRVAYSLDYYNDRFQPADLNFIQTGWYVQDEWEVNNQLKLTGGLRVDIPIFVDKPTYNPLFEEEFGRNTSNVPSGQLLWSPRLGFNYDVKGDQSLQLRGGAGIFTGRVPFVWISNAYTNAGATISTLSVRGNSGSVGNVPFYPLDGDRTYEAYIANELGVGIDDPAVRTEIQNRQASAPTSQIDALDDKLKMPQNLRTNFAVDAALPWGLTGTFEAIYTKTINGIKYDNLQVPAADGTIPGEENRPTYSTNRINTNFFDVFLLENTNKGYQYSFTGQLTKSWSENFFGTVAYTYGVAKDVNGGTHTTANSGWEFNPTPGSPDEAIVGYSVWDLRHRLMGNFNYVFDYSDNASTSIGLFVNAQSGAPFSYLVQGDLNGDGASGNDQSYIPTSSSDIVFGTGNTPADAATQAALWSQLDAFIERDNYLSENRGIIAERNAARTPWTSKMDVRLMQEFKLMVNGKANRLQVSLDIENLANLLNREWGTQYFVNFDTYNLLELEGFNGNTPIYTYNDREEPWSISNSETIWRMQLGFRYIFN